VPYSGLEAGVEPAGLWLDELATTVADVLVGIFLVGIALELAAR
jgi:hypothetical protein